ncbi:MAG: rod shape-determining protein MreD [Phycisphaerae bacterium]|nr:rod shape-determining protein MreD [Phycisphaerae bacterium]
MRWLPFTILAVLALVLQTTVAQWVHIYSRDIWPNCMFILAVHYALWGPWPDAAIAAWILGFAVDLQTISSGGGVGLYAFSFGGSAWIIMRIRHAFVRDHALTQVLVTLTFTLLIELLVGAYRQRGAWSRDGAAAVWWPAMGRAVYTSALAPYLHWPLVKLGRWTGLKPQTR